MKRFLKILLGAEAFFILAAGMLGPIYAIFVEKIGGNILAASGAWAAFAVTSGIILYFIGRWEDHVKHQGKLVVIGYGLKSIGFLGYLLVSNPIELFMVQIVLGLGTAIGIPAYDSLYSKWLDRGKYASEWALWEAMDYIMSAIAAIIGGILVYFYGFQILFIGMFIFSIFGLSISLRISRK